MVKFSQPIECNVVSNGNKTKQQGTRFKQRRILFQQLINEINCIEMTTDCQISNTTDTHLPSIIKENQNECCICLYDKDLTIVFNCNHHVCLPCFKQYAITNLNRRQFKYDPNIGYSLGCPSGCSNTLLQELHIFRLMDKTNYERYKTFGAEEYVFYHQGVICPTVSCGCGLIVDESNLKVFCPLPIGCGKTFCRNCKNLWEDDSMQICPCQNDNRREDNRSFSIWNYVVGYRRAMPTVPIKRCPRCSVKTEKDGGCNAISCTRCGMTWCWICEMEFRTDCIQSHWF